MCVIYVLCLSCSRVCSLLPCGHQLGKNWPLGSCLWCLIVIVVSWVRCGTWLYWFLIFAVFLIQIKHLDVYSYWTVARMHACVRTGCQHYIMRGSNKCCQKTLMRAIICQPAKHNLNGVLLACQWWTNIECWLGMFVILQWIPNSTATVPYSRVDTDPLPLDPRMYTFGSFEYQQYISKLRYKKIIISLHPQALPYLELTYYICKF